MPKNFAFIRVVPIKNWGKGASRKRSKTGRGWGVTGCAAHDLRFIETPNADAKKLRFNSIVTAKTGWNPLSATKGNLTKIGIDGPGYLAEMAKEMIAEKGIKLKSTQVKVSMLMCAVSPEFLRDGDKNGKLNADKVCAWGEATVKYLREKYGDTLLSVVFHFDEMNPHASAYLVPMIEKNIKTMGPPRKGAANQLRESTKEWRMSHRDLFTRDRKIFEVDPVGNKKSLGVERGTCSKMQDDYAQALQEMGLDVQRGIRKAEGKRALEYESMAEIYKRNRAEETIKEIQNLRDDELRQWILAKIPRIEKTERIEIERDHYQIAAGSAQEKAAKLEALMSTNERELPVGDVIKKLTGLEPLDPDGPPSGRKDIQMEFVMPNGMKVGVTNQNGFENLTPKIPFEGKNSKRFRGKGALDAVMFLTGWDLKAASEWLADNYSVHDAGKTIAKKYNDSLAFNPDDHERIVRKNYAETVTHDLETPDCFQWEDTSKLLLRTFKVRKQLVEDLHESTWISANKFGHIVFQKGLWDNDGDLVPAGNVIIDPANPLITLKETGDGMYFDIDNKATKVIICSSPMEALAIRSTPDHYASTLVVVGKSPTAETIKSLEYVIKKHRGKKILAESVSSAGRKLAAWMLEHFPAIETLPLPKGFENWLDYHKRPRLESDPADLRVVEFPKKNQANPDDMTME